MWQFYKTPRIPNPPRPELWKIDPARYGRSNHCILNPLEFHQRTQPIVIQFKKPSNWNWKSFLSGVFVGLLLLGLYSHAPSAYDYTKAFVSTSTATLRFCFLSLPRASASLVLKHLSSTVLLHSQPTTTPAAPFVLAPKYPTNSFLFDAGILAQSMTPARLTESQATAMSQVLSPPPVDPVEPVAPTVEGDSADSCATNLCQILEAAKPALSVASKAARPYLLLTSKVFGLTFLESYLLGEPHEEEDDKNDDASSQSIDYFDWVVDVDQAVFHGTTPASLPMVNEESASAFFDMTLGHKHKGKKYVSAVEAALNDLFVLDYDLLKQSVTPARLTEVQGHGLFELRAPAEDKCCPMDILCRLFAVAPKYIPELLELLGYDDYNSNKLAPNFAWITTVWDQAIYRETTPAFLPSGRTNEDSGISFYELTEGHSRNPEPDAASTDFWRPNPPFQRRIKIVNESGGNLEVYYVRRSTRDTELISVPSVVQGAEFLVDTHVGHEFEFREMAGPSGTCKDHVCRQTFFTVSENDEQVARVTADFETIVVDSKIKAEMHLAATCPGTHAFFAVVRKVVTFGQKSFLSVRHFLRANLGLLTRCYQFLIVFVFACIACDFADGEADVMPGMIPAD